MLDNAQAAGLGRGGLGQSRQATQGEHTTIRRARQAGRQVYVSSHFVGEVRGKVFTKRVKGSRHMLLKPRGRANVQPREAQAEQLALL